MCFFCVYSITSRNNASISNFGSGFRLQNEYLWCIIEVKSKHFLTVLKKIEKKQKRVTEKREFFFTQNQFSTKSIFYMVVIQKVITVNTYNFHHILMLLFLIHG
ncbi:Uncharacterized protein FWK35_00009212 [Aphis craccivora]|uniref:Uncharacterized protein n=1 Tax=Aphis craccivora TaxID=307492 RepID=A0A6G0YPB0_APHCR|nr:Uncharacterized protein FWK35_00009212 [Aphis craccivora]